MTTIATPTTAALAGVWSALYWTAFEGWAKSHPLDAGTLNAVFFVGGLFFFIGPNLLYVFGIQALRDMYQLPFALGIRHLISKAYWKELLKVGRRMICWFLGAALFGMVYARFVGS